MSHKLRALIPQLAFVCALVAACGAQTEDKAPAPALSPTAAGTTQAVAGTGGEALDRSVVSAASWDAGPNSGDYTMALNGQPGKSASIICDEGRLVLSVTPAGAPTLPAEGRLVVGSDFYVTRPIPNGRDILLEVVKTRQFIGSLGSAASIKIDAGQLQIEIPAPPPLMVTWFKARCAEYIDTGEPGGTTGSSADGFAAASAAARAGRPLAERSFRDQMPVGIAGPEMIALPAGKFTMGSPKPDGFDNERPQRLITIDREFAVGKFEITWEEFNLCRWEGPCSPISDDGFGGGRRPVTNVSWEDAKTYVEWLSRATGQNYRLLSEAEWEYADRAGSTTTYPWGPAPSVGKANCDGCGSQWDNKSTAPVGSFEANGFGLHDMAGNAWEWVEDCFAGSYSAGQPTNGAAFSPDDCEMRVNRGGSWATTVTRLRSANRLMAYPADRFEHLGFRVARS